MQFISNFAHLAVSFHCRALAAGYSPGLIRNLHGHRFIQILTCAIEATASSLSHIPEQIFWIIEPKGCLSALLNTWRRIDGPVDNEDWVIIPQEWLSGPFHN